MSSYFLGDPPPDPRFLASLGTLSPVELDHCSVVDINRLDRPEGPASRSVLGVSWLCIPAYELGRNEYSPPIGHGDI